MDYPLTKKFKINIKNFGRHGALPILALGACEVLIMISPFAGFFYASVRFEPLLEFLSASPLTAWLDGFFLNHSVVTSSTFIEWQRKAGRYIFAVGIWGFFISALQVYGNKILKRGMATRFLYRISMHPQYLCLGIAGWGLLTIWPRFLLLGIWVTMLFMYAGLARSEESRMEKQFGQEYHDYSAGKGTFLPGNPVRRIFQVTFACIRPRAAGWVAAYAFCLALAFSAGFLLRSRVLAATAIQMRPEYQTAAISAWPQSPEWLRNILDITMENKKVRERLKTRGNLPLVATILPPHYFMKGMFYKMPPQPPQLIDPSGEYSTAAVGFKKIAIFSVVFLAPFTLPANFMGVDPDTSDEPVEVVIARAEKPYKNSLLLEEALDTSVRLTPLVVVEVQPNTRKITKVMIPLPQNEWGPNVVMPLL